MRHVCDIQARHRTGTVYLMVLGCSMIVMVIGMGSLFALRVHRRSVQITQDASQARCCAQSAIALGRLHCRVETWRTIWPDGTWLSNQVLGTGQFTLQGVDPQDGDLTDSEFDPVVLTAIGTKGFARHKVQVTLVPDIQPIEALSTCLYCLGRLDVDYGEWISVTGAPISTGGALDNDGVIYGDAEAGSVEDAGWITGTLTVPADPVHMPGDQVITDYIAKATVLPRLSTMEKRVFSPTRNPLGSPNPDGVYYMDTQGNDLTLRNSRIHGTLIVRAEGGRVIVDDAVFMQPAREDYPVLIVIGDAVLKYDSYDYSLREWYCGTNFNPTGAPYQGISDTDLSDWYPNEIQGLVHITGSLRLQNSAKIVGVVICHGSVRCEDRNRIVYNSALAAHPPVGYTYVAGMKVSQGTFAQGVD